MLSHMKPLLGGPLSPCQHFPWDSRSDNSFPPSVYRLPLPVSHLPANALPLLGIVQWHQNLSPRFVC